LGDSTNLPYILKYQQIPAGTLYASKILLKIKLNIMQIVYKERFDLNLTEQKVEKPTFRLTDNLPNLLKEMVLQFKEEKDQELFLLSVLTASSGLITKVYGHYKQQVLYPNLFLVEVAPAASGKSIMMYSVNLLSQIHDKFKKESDKAQLDYKTALKEAQRSKNPIPPKPPFNVVLIPANSSASKIHAFLGDNELTDTPSVIIESEIDTLVSVTKNDWGNFSDTLRKAFHNERASMSRRLDNEYVEIKSPKIALALSGTMNQVRKLITNTENGLYSRFVVYTLEQDLEWKSPAPCADCPDLTHYFNERGKDFLAFYEFMSKNPLEIDLTAEQWRKLDAFGDENLNEINAYENDNVASIVFRHAVILYKIAMVLSAFRQWEDQTFSEKRFCKDEDFELALYLAKTSLKSSLKIFKLLPGGQLEKAQDKSEEFLSEISVKFTHKEALEFAEKLGVKGRTIERYLKNLLKKGKLIQRERGKYEKVSVTE
jgi:hypothetical protein